MEIKMEPNDELFRASISKDRSIVDDIADNAETILNQGQQTAVKYKVPIKQEPIYDDREEAINEVTIDSTSVKNERDIEWQYYKKDFTEGICPMKRGKKVNDQCSYDQTTTPAQFQKMDFELASLSLTSSLKTKSLIISDTGVLVPDKEKQNDIFKQELVAIILLKRISFNERNFVCRKCFEIFPSFGTLKIHENVHVNLELSSKSCKTKNIPKEKPFKCDECDCKFSYQSKLKTHKMSHTGEKPFKCDVCNFKCAYFSYLKIHKTNHTGDKPLCCDICEFKCTHLSVLKRHKLSHTKEKLLNCDQCSFKTNRSWHLNSHKLIHTGHKPFECDQCSYKTVYFYNLKGHKVSHTGEKPFKCDKCDYKCAISSNLLIHKRKHTGERPYKCDKCEYKSTTSSHLKRHKMTH